MNVSHLPGSSHDMNPVKSDLELLQQVIGKKIIITKRELIENCYSTKSQIRCEWCLEFSKIQTFENFLKKIFKCFSGFVVIFPHW